MSSVSIGGQEHSLSSSLQRQRESFRKKDNLTPTNVECKAIRGMYELKETLGIGRHGEVKRAKHILTGREVAIKFIPVEDCDDAARWSEVAALKRLHHPHVVRLYDVIRGEDSVLLVLECLTGGELFDYLVSRRRLSEPETRRFVRQMLKALDYCHREGVVHRDLKLENLLLSDSDNIKITDFGFSNMFLEGGLMSTFVGSPAYAAPEILANEKYCGPKVDIWSLGVILYTLLTGDMPFQDENIAVILGQINRADYPMPDSISAEAADLIRRLLCRNPEERLSMSEVRSHPWLQRGEVEAPDVDVESIKRRLHANCLASLAGLGLDTAQVQRDLDAGNMTRDTATYHIRLDQLFDEDQRREADNEIARIIASLPTSQPGARRNSPFFLFGGGSAGDSLNTASKAVDDDANNETSTAPATAPAIILPPVVAAAPHSGVYSPITPISRAGRGSPLTAPPQSALLTAPLPAPLAARNNNALGLESIRRAALIKRASGTSTTSGDDSDHRPFPRFSDLSSTTSSTHGSVIQLPLPTGRLSTASEGSMDSSPPRRAVPSAQARLSSRASICSEASSNHPGRRRRVSTFGATVTQCDVDLSQTGLFSPRGTSDMSVFSSQDSRDLLPAESSASPHASPVRVSSPASPVSPATFGSAMASPRLLRSLAGFRAAAEHAASGAANAGQQRVRHGSADASPILPRKRRGSHKVTVLLDEAHTTLFNEVGAVLRGSDNRRRGSVSASVTRQQQQEQLEGRRRSSTCSGEHMFPSATADAHAAVRAAAKRTAMTGSPTKASATETVTVTTAVSNSAARVSARAALASAEFRGRSQSTTMHNRPRRSGTSTAPCSKLGRTESAEPEAAHKATVKTAMLGIQDAELSEATNSLESLDMGALDLASGLSSFGAATTSTKSIDEIKRELTQALQAEHVEFSSKGQAKNVIRCRTSNSRHSPRTRHRSMRSGNNGTVVWEMAITNLEKLGMRGIRLKRIAGNHWDYKSAVERVISRCHL